MINKHKLYLRVLVSVAMILMLVSLAGAGSFAYIPNSGSNNVSNLNKSNEAIKAMINQLKLTRRIQWLGTITELLYIN